MSFLDLLIHSVTVYNLTAGSTGRYGDESQTFDAGTVYAARVEQSDLGGQGREELEGRDTTSTYFKVFTLPSVNVTAYSHIVWGTTRMAVDGEPKLLYDGDGAHHYEIMCKEVVGG